LCKKGLHLETLKGLGSNWDLSEDLSCNLEKFTCQIYSSSTSLTKVNDLRFTIFCARKGEVESWQLPPCSSSLLNHSKRANYQCAIWKRSLEAFPFIPSPVGYGWSLENGELHIDWSTAAPAPEIVMELLSCTCTRQCSAETCTCVKIN